jgi:hypothetical protein
MTDVSPLRRRMIEDMTIRNLSRSTQQSYIYAVAKFSRHCGRSPDRLGLEDVRAYQLHLIAQQRRGHTSIRQSARCGSSMALHWAAVMPTSRSLGARAATIAGGAQRRGDRAVPRGGARPAQPCCPDHCLWRGPARRRGRSPDGSGHRQQPDADPYRAR